jgi:DNA-cytosine methyltransferase
MNVLSLFDGMSCGRIALERLGIPVDNYYASEIDKYAIQVSQANYPDIIQVGDVTELDTSTLPKIDLIMGGSPCQGFSFAGKQLAFDDPRSALFFEFVRCVEELKPKYFLLENVRMKKEYLDVISEYMGVEPIMINSALVSAQNRVRFYWTNIPGIEQPEDRGMVLRDILETNASNEYLAGENLQKNYKGGNQLNPNYKSQANTIHDTEGKSGTICAGTHGYANGYVADVDPKYYLSDKAIDYMNRGSNKYTGNKTRAEHYIKHESEKSKTLTANMHKGVPYGVIAVDVFSEDRINKFKETLKDNPKPSANGIIQLNNPTHSSGRVYSPEGKSPTLMAGNSGGGKEPVKIRDVISVDKEKKQLTIKEATKKGYTTIEDGDCFDMTFPNSKTRRGRNMKDKSNCLTAANYDYMRYEHSDEDKEVYWRKLTPVECERLQTVPDNYTNHVSNTQRYKMLGNGWTIEVITHILKNMELPNDQTCDKSGS